MHKYSICGHNINVFFNVENFREFLGEVYMSSSKDRIKHFLESAAIQSDCTSKCRSKIHRKMCRNAIMNKSCSDEYVAAYLLYACQNFYKNCSCYQGLTSSNKFRNGDNILHWICSSSSVVSKSNLLAWMFENFGSQDEILNARDVESGYTPLHKSILYGNLACSQILLKHGAAINVRDFDGLTAIDLLNANTNTVVSDKNVLNFLYGCGENVSYNLGHSLPIRKSQFDVIDFPSSSFIKRISMSNYHTLFLTKSGSILTCGHGACGRLGLGDENAQIVPKLIETVVLASNVEQQTQTTTPSSKIQFSFVSASNNHSLSVSVDGDAYSWGDNSHRSLGHSANPNDKELRPRLIHFPKNFKNTCQFVGCAASNFASVLWSHNSIYTFGENLGHLGHSKQDGQFLHFARKVIMSTIKIVEYVTMNNSATAIVAAKGDVFVWQNFECKKVASRMLDLKTVCLFPDDSSTTTAASTKLLILTSNGKIFFWQTGEAVPTRVVFLGVPHIIYPVHVACSTNCVHLTAPNGDFFVGDCTKIVQQNKSNVVPLTVSPSKLQDQFPSNQVRNTKNQQLKLEHENSYKESLKSLVKPRNASAAYFQCQKPNLLDYSSCVRLPIRRQWNIFGAEWSACSPDGQNTLVYVQQPTVRVAQMSEILNERTNCCLLNDFRRFYEELDEESADLIVDCGTVKFPAHKFILASRSKYFAEKLRSDAKRTRIKAPEGLSANIFGQALRSIYFMELQNHVLQTKSLSSKAANKLNAGAASAINSALKTLQVDSFDNGFKFDAHQWPELVDISLICVDGQELPCHRCVLCARVDYFRCMFASHWMEASVNQAKFKINADSRVAKILLQYIYQDRIDEIFPCKPDENDLLILLCKLLVVADEWLLDGLKRLCEMELCKLVSLKNSIEILQLAQTYNAENLHKCCRIFVCLNLFSLITSSQFLNLDTHLVTKLEETYKNEGFNAVCSPVKTYDNRAVVEAVETAFVTLKSCDIDDDLDVLCQEYVKRTTNIVDQSDFKKVNVEIALKRQQSQLPESPVSSFKAPNFPTAAQDARQSSASKIDGKNSVIKNDSLQSPDFSDEKQKLSIAERSRAKRIAGWFEPSSPPSDATFSMISLRDVMDLEEKMQLEAETKKKEIIKKATPPSMPIVKKGWNTCATANNSHQSTSAIFTLAAKPPASDPIPIFPAKTPLSKKTSRDSPTAYAKIWTPSAAAERPAVSFSAVSPSLSEIIRDEESSLILRREILNKPLKFIQIEEQALQELRMAYDADNNFDESITVERFFEGRVAEPYWQAHEAESL